MLVPHNDMCLLYFSFLFMKIILRHLSENKIFINPKLVKISAPHKKKDNSFLFLFFKLFFSIFLRSFLENLNFNDLFFIQFLKSFFKNLLGEKN